PFGSCGLGIPTRLGGRPMDFRLLLRSLGEHLWLATALAMFVLTYRIFMKTLSPKSGYGRLLDIIRPDISWLEKYRQILRLGLDRLEDFISPHRRRSNQLLAKFDSESFEKFFVLALIYPVLSTVYNYLAFNTGAYLGPLFFFPGTTSIIKKAVVLLVY